jgi:hypothetical protein
VDFPLGKNPKSSKLRRLIAIHLGHQFIEVGHIVILSRHGSLKVDSKWKPHGKPWKFDEE